MTMHKRMMFMQGPGCEKGMDCCMGMKGCEKGGMDKGSCKMMEGCEKDGMKKDCCKMMEGKIQGDDQEVKVVIEKKEDKK